MAINENNIETTPGTNPGGTSVSGPTDPIKAARKQVYETLKSTSLTFQDFEEAIDDPNYRTEVLESLANDPKLKGWTVESLSSALFEGKLNEVSSPGSEPTSVTSAEPLPNSQNSKPLTDWQKDANEVSRALQGTTEVDIGAGTETRTVEGIDMPEIVVGDNGQLMDVTFSVEMDEPDVASRSFMQNLENSLNNNLNQVKGFDDRVAITGASIAKKIVNLVDSDELNHYIGQDLDEVIAAAFANIERYNMANKSVGEFTEMTSGSDFASAIADSFLAITYSALVSKATNGVGLATDMVGGSIADANQIKADRLGISVKELYSRGQEDFVAPVALGSLGFVLEKVGLKGMKSAINRRITSTYGKYLTTVAMDVNKEGMTELVQHGLEEVNKHLASGGNVADSSEIMAKAMFSKQGLESYLKGLAGSGVVATPSIVANSVLDGKKRTQALALDSERRALIQELSKPEVMNDQAVRDAVLAKIEDTSEKLQEVVDSDFTENKNNRSADEVAQLEDTTKRIAHLEERINSTEGEVLSEEVKGALKDEKARLETQLEENLKENEEQSIVQDTEVPVESVSNTSPTEANSEAGELVREVATPGFFETISDGDLRSARIAELLNNMKSNLTDDSAGIANDPKAKAKQELGFLRDLTEYAVLQIADGTIKTAEEFKSMAKGIVDFGDDVLNKAFYAAQKVAQSYVDSGPTNTQISDAIGNTLANLKNEDKDRTAPKTKVTAKDARNLTDGGTRGKIIKTIKQAHKDYYASLNKGAKMGERGAKESAKIFRDSLAKSLGEVIKNSPVKLSKALSNKTLTTLVNRVASARTDADMNRAIDYVDALVGKAENVKFAEDLNSKVAKAKKMSKSERLPANIKEVLGKFGSLAPRDLMRSEVLQGFTRKFIDGIVGKIDDLTPLLKTGAEGKGNIAKIEELNRDLDTLNKVLEDERFSEELPSLEEHLKELGKASGVTMSDGYFTPKNYSDYNNKVQELESMIPEDLDAPKTKSKSRESNEEFVLNNLGLINDVDLSSLTDQELEVVEAMKELTPEVLDKMIDADVFKLSIGLSNLINNGRLDGLGSPIYKAKAKALYLDTGFTQSIAKAVLSIPAMGKVLGTKGYSRWAKLLMSKSQIIDSLFNDLFTKGKFLGRFGLQAYKEGRNVANRKYEIALKKFGEMAKKDPAVKEFMRSPTRGVDEIKLGIRAWMEQREYGLSPDDIKALKDKKIETLKTMAKMLGEGLNKMFAEQDINSNRNYFKNLAEALDSYIKDPDFELSEGQAKVYEYGKGLFEGIRPEFLANARLFNNVDLDMNIENYFPIDYKFYDETANDVLLDTSYNRSFSGAKMTGRSGSKSARERTIKDGQLPKNAILDFNFVDNMFKNYGLQLADIHTQGPRMQIHHNLMDRDLRSATSGNNFFTTIGDMMQEEMQEDYQYFRSPKHLTIMRRLKRNFMSTAYARALGGFSQGFKQFVPTITDSLIRTGDWRTAFWYVRNSGLANEFMKNQDISRRGVQSSQQMGASVANEIDTMHIPNAAVRTLADALDFHDKILNKVVMKPLQFGDVSAAKMSWMMYYKQYADKHGISVDLTKAPNKEAAAFADNLIDVTANTSVDSNKAKFTQTIWAKMFIPFTGASLTSFANMSVSTSKLTTAIATGDMTNAKDALRAMAANSSAIALFQGVGWFIRWGSYGALKMVSNKLIESIDLDDDEEEEEVTKNLKLVVEDYYNKRVSRNNENSINYLANDILHRGIISQGMFEAATNVLVKPIIENLTGTKVNTYKSSDDADELFELLGVYGIVPAGVYGAVKKNQGILDNAEESLRRSGYGAYLRADGTYGYEAIDGSKMPESLRRFQKTVNMMSIASAIGIQDQFISSLTRTAPKMYKQFEDAFYKNIPKVKDVTSDKQFKDKFTTMQHEGREMKLDDSEQKVFREAYDKVYKREYKQYMEDRLPMLPDGPKLQGMAIKFLYREAKKELLENPEFKKLWDAKSTKSKK